MTRLGAMVEYIDPGPISQTPILLTQTASRPEESQPMVHPASLFSQVLRTIPHPQFQRHARRLRSDKYGKGFSSWEQCPRRAGSRFGQH